MSDELSPVERVILKALRQQNWALIELVPQHEIGMLRDHIHEIDALLSAQPQQASVEGEQDDCWPTKPPCIECGAVTEKQAETMCICSGDKDHCHGCDLWDTPASPEATPEQYDGPSDKQIIATLRENISELLEQEPDTGGQIALEQRCDALVAFAIDMRRRYQNSPHIVHAANMALHGPTPAEQPIEQAEPKRLVAKGLNYVGMTHGHTQVTLGFDTPRNASIFADLIDSVNEMLIAPTPEQPSGEDGEGGEITRLALAGAISREKEANREWSKAAMERDETKRQLEALQAKYSELEGLVVDYKAAKEAWNACEDKTTKAAADKKFAMYYAEDQLIAYVDAHHTEARGDKG